jgi:outer membrane biosynthesis protein TonB
VHVLLLGAAWWGQRLPSDPYEYVAYELTIVSPPSEGVDQPLAAAEPVVDRPETPPPPEPDPEPEPQPEPELPEPLPEPEPTPEPPPEPEPEPAPAPDPEPAPTPQAPAAEETPSAAAMAVRMEGLRRDFPAYYQRIVEEIGRCFRWDGRGQGSWTSVLRFEIRRDGTIPGSSIRFFQRSGNGTFDIEAAGAVECAGRGVLGPLPDDMPYEVLPVQFTFGPARLPGE